MLFKDLPSGSQFILTGERYRKERDVFRPDGTIDKGEATVIAFFAVGAGWIPYTNPFPVAVCPYSKVDGE